MGTFHIQSGFVVSLEKPDLALLAPTPTAATDWGRAGTVPLHRARTFQCVPASTHYAQPYWPSFTHLAYSLGPADITCCDSRHIGFMGVCGDKQVTELPSEQNCKCTLYKNISFYCTSLSFMHIVFFIHWSFVAILCQTILPPPFFQQHLLTSYLCVTFWKFAQYFKCFVIIISAMVTFDVTIVVWGQHEPHPYKTENLINKCCVWSDCSPERLLSWG